MIHIISISMSGAFVTGDDEGYATIWDARSRKRLIEVFSYQVSFCVQLL